MRTRLLFLVGVFLVFSKSYGQGHYAGSGFNTNDYFVPQASGWVFPLYYSSSSMKFYNDAGKKVDVIQIAQNPPTFVTVGQKVRARSVIPMAIYFGKKKVLNAKWGLMLLPLINNPNANIALDFYVGQNSGGSQNISINAFGLGDTYFQPLWLTWEKNKFSTAVSYGLWLPTGRFKVNDPKNIGMGYLSHNFRVAGRYKPQPAYTLVGALTFEANSKQKGIDFKEAPHLTFDYAAAYSFKMGHEIGLMGFGTWQLGDDKGSKAVLNPDRVYGLGAYGAYWLKPGKFGVLGRFSQNFGTRNRFGGFSFQLGLNYLLMK